VYWRIRSPENLTEITWHLNTFDVIIYVQVEVDFYCLYYYLFLIYFFKYGKFKVSSLILFG